MRKIHKLILYTNGIHGQIISDEIFCKCDLYLNIIDAIDLNSYFDISLFNSYVPFIIRSNNLLKIQIYEWMKCYENLP